MSKSSMTLRDLVGSCVQTGSTLSKLNVNQTSATDLVRACITEGTVNIPWSTTDITYNISGYTITNTTEGATEYNFYVNTGETLLTLSSGVTGDTLLSTYISGSTVVPSGITVTEIITITTGTTTEVNNSLNVSINGGDPTFDYITLNDVVDGAQYHLYISGGTLKTVSL